MHRNASFCTLARVLRLLVDLIEWTLSSGFGFTWKLNMKINGPKVGKDAGAGLNSPKSVKMIDPAELAAQAMSEAATHQNHLWRLRHNWICSLFKNEFIHSRKHHCVWINGPLE